MKRLSGRSLAWVAALLLLLAPGAARADFYSNWSFSWSFNPIPPNAPGFVPAEAGGAPGGTATGGAQFAASAGTSGASTIPVATVSTTSSATTTPDSFQASPFTFAVTITDNADHASGTLTFDGVLNGQLAATSSSAVAALSLDPGSPASLLLNGRTYTVALGPSLALPAPGGQALLNATVTVGASNPGGPPPPPPPPPVQGVPEPSGLALAGAGLSLLAARAWRRARAARPVA